MHAVMMSSSPPLIYWQNTTREILRKVRQWRQEGINACTTIDAGPNVHVICTQAESEKVLAKLEEIDGIKQILSAGPGGPAQIAKL